MSQLGFGTQYFARELGNYAEIPVTNMIAEKQPGKETADLLSRPGLKDSEITAGAGPVTAMYSRSGVYDGAMFIVSGSNFYRDGTNLGSIGTVTNPSIASYKDKVFVCSGTRLFFYDGFFLNEVTIEEVPTITKVVVGMSRAIVLAGDSQTFYWSEPLDTDFDVLAFAEAENSPDDLIDMLFLGDTLTLFGTNTVEFWPSTTSMELPFAPLVGRTYQRGAKSVGASCMFAGAFAWVTNVNTICIGSLEGKVSNATVEEKIAKEPSVKLWSFLLDGKELLALELSDQTLVFDASTALWSEFESYGQSKWIPSTYENNYFGSRLSGTLIEWDRENFSDFGGVLERRFQAGADIEESNVFVDNLTVRCNVGWTSYTEGQYANPTIESRASRDGGWTWSNWRTKTLGPKGAYDHRVVWNSYGQFRQPGVTFQIRVTDPVPFRVSYVGINEALR